MKKVIIIFYIVIFLILLNACNPLQWASYPEQEYLENLSQESWREDLDYLLSKLLNGNPHLSQDTTLREEFIDAVSELESSIVSEDLSPEEIITGIAKALALLEEGHTSINTSPVTYYPLLGRWLPLEPGGEEFLFVIAADKTILADEGEEVLGAQILGIRKPPTSGSGALYFNGAEGELETLLNSVISADHENGYRNNHGNILSNPVLLKGLGLADSTGITYILKIEEEERDLSVGEIRGEDVDLSRIYDDSLKPLSSLSSESNWYTFTGENQDTIYLKYSHCTFDAYPLFQGVLNLIKKGEVQKLIVDLRWNSGGVSVPGTWFVRQIQGIPWINSPGNLFVLIGPTTFSSGMWMVVDFMAWTEAIFAGKPLATGPDSFGEVKRFKLPNSGLVIGHSTKFFNYSRGKELLLDDSGIPLPTEGYESGPTLEQYRQGEDPVLKMVLEGGEI